MMMINVTRFCAAVAAIVLSTHADWPAEIAPLFEPPPDFAGKLGGYRSPLLFETTHVASARMAQERAEIRASGRL